MTEVISTNLIVPGRGHEITPDGGLELSASSAQRALAAVAYFGQYRAAFEQAQADRTGGIIVMAGGYAGLATGGTMAPPPYSKRESTLMCQLAATAGVPGEFLGNSPASTSTLENILRAQEEGFFTDIDSGNPLGIVTQKPQWKRLCWFARKVLQLPQDAITLIPAPGEEDPQIIRDEQKLLAATRVIYGAARTAAGFRRAERVASRIAVLTRVARLQSPPAATYTNIPNTLG